MKEALQDTMLSNPEKHKESEEEKKIFDDIVKGVIYDVEPEDIVMVDADIEKNDDVNNIV